MHVTKAASKDTITYNEEGMELDSTIYCEYSYWYVKENELKKIFTAV